jgi:hypothetical protein
VAKEKPFTKQSGRPTKDKDPMISGWLEDAREHLVTIPDEKSRIDFLMQNLLFTHYIYMYIEITTLN